jgi:hypothetical protein
MTRMRKAMVACEGREGAAGVWDSGWSGFGVEPWKPVGWGFTIGRRALRTSSERMVRFGVVARIRVFCLGLYELSLEMKLVVVNAGRWITQTRRCCDLGLDRWAVSWPIR